MGEKKKALPPLSKGNREASNRPLSTNKSSAVGETKSTVPMRKKPTEKMEVEEIEVGKQTHNKMEIEVSLNKIIQEYEFEMSRLEVENQELRNGREIAEKNYMIVANDNNALQIKLENLEQLFIKNSSSKKNMNQEYMNINLAAENKSLKAQMADIEDQIYELQEATLKKELKSAMAMSSEEKEIRVMNRNLKDRIEFLRSRELELMSLLSKKKK